MSLLPRCGFLQPFHTFLSLLLCVCDTRADLLHIIVLQKTAVNFTSHGAEWCHRSLEGFRSWQIEDSSKTEPMNQDHFHHISPVWPLPPSLQTIPPDVSHQPSWLSERSTGWYCGEAAAACGHGPCPAPSPAVTRPSPLFLSARCSPLSALSLPINMPLFPAQRDKHTTRPKDWN